MLPDAPLFFVQQTYFGRRALPPIAVARQAQRRSLPGLLLDFGAVPLQSVRDDARNRGKLSPLLADSAVYGCADKRGVPMAPWVQRRAPSRRAEWDAVVRDSVAEQTSLGVDAIVVPGMELASGAYPNEFERQTDAIRRAWRARGSNAPAWFARVSIHDDWLANANMRRFLLNHLSDLPDEIGISLHVRFSRRDAAGDIGSLSALREVIRVLSDDGRRVFLVQSGIVGWLALAWGAWGFSAGISQGSWLDSREEIRRRRGTRSPARLERFLQPQLLHHVLSGDRARLSNLDGYVPCPCVFCSALNGTWNAQTAAQHDLWALAELTERVAARDRTVRRDLVRDIVEAAQNQWAVWSRTPGLSPRARPRHLAAWRSVI